MPSPAVMGIYPAESVQVSLLFAPCRLVYPRVRQLQHST